MLNNVCIFVVLNRVFFSYIKINFILFLASKVAQVPTPEKKTSTSEVPSLPSDE